MLTHVTNLLTHVTNFVISVTNFVTNFFCADSEKWLIGTGKCLRRKEKIAPRKFLRSAQIIATGTADNRGGHGRKQCLPSLRGVRKGVLGG